MTKCKCNKKIESKFSEKDKLYFFYCTDCKIGGKGKTEELARGEFLKAQSKVDTTTPTPAQDATNYTGTLMVIEPPKSAVTLHKWAEQNMLALLESSAQFIDKPATKRMIMRNVKYLMSVELKDAWNTPEGQESISNALTESFEIGATLPEMGAIVAFGKTVEFIPAIEAVDFALTTGKSAPFKYISIEPLYDNDKYTGPGRDYKGEFNFEITQMGFPRGDLIGIVVKGFSNSENFVVGEAYDIKTLTEKAQKHSKSYQYYLKDLQDAKKAQAEGKKFQKWGKDVDPASLSNPYEDADKVDMFKKLAGKNFFKKYLRTRNARAVSEEWKDGEREEMTDSDYADLIDESISKLSDEPEIKDAEIIKPEKKAGILFDEDL
jgi:hypothetical protein